VILELTHKNQPRKKVGAGFSIVSLSLSGSLCVEVSTKSWMSEGYGGAWFPELRGGCKLAEEDHLLRRGEDRSLIPTRGRESGEVGWDKHHEPHQGRRRKRCGYHPTPPKEAYNSNHGFIVVSCLQNNLECLEGIGIYTLPCFDRIKEKSDIYDKKMNLTTLSGVLNAG